MCKNHHEAADGNIGVLVRNEGELDARLNLGGGGANSHQVVGDKRHALKFESWNHVALSYDGQVLHVDQWCGERDDGLCRWEQFSIWMKTVTPTQEECPGMRLD